MKLGSTQRIVLDNVAARRAPYAGHRSHAEYGRRMEVARNLERRGLLASLPFGHPENTGLASTYRLTAAGAEARGDRGGGSRPTEQAEVDRARTRKRRFSGGMTAASVFEVALATARRTRVSSDYREAARRAGDAAGEAPYGDKETYWLQADELNAMADVLADAGDVSPRTIERDVARVVSR